MRDATAAATLYLALWPTGSSMPNSPKEVSRGHTHGRQVREAPHGPAVDNHHERGGRRAYRRVPARARAAGHAPAHFVPVAVRYLGLLPHIVPVDHGRDVDPAVRPVRDVLENAAAGLPADVPLLAADLRGRVRDRRGGRHRARLR